MKLGDKYAFPREEYQTPTDRGQPGMTLRQYYAGLAMQAEISKAPVKATYEDIAAYAVCHADALLAELEK